MEIHPDISPFYKARCVPEDMDDHIYIILNDFFDDKSVEEFHSGGIFPHQRRV